MFEKFLLLYENGLWFFFIYFCYFNKIISMKIAYGAVTNGEQWYQTGLHCTIRASWSESYIHTLDSCIQGTLA